MKSIMLIFLLVASISLFAQQTSPAPVLSKQDYLQKSKNQNTTAWVLAGGGTALVIAGLVNYGNKVENTDNPFEVFDTGELWLSVIGGIALSASIRFFIASSKNKQKAMSFTFDQQTIPGVQKNGWGARTIPSIQLTLLF